MPVYGTCDKCKGETIDYECGYCDAEEILDLKAKIAQEENKRKDREIAIVHKLMFKSLECSCLKNKLEGPYSGYFYIQRKNAPALKYNWEDIPVVWVYSGALFTWPEFELHIHLDGDSNENNKLKIHSTELGSVGMIDKHGEHHWPKYGV